MGLLLMKKIAWMMPWSLIAIIERIEVKFENCTGWNTDESWSLLSDFPGITILQLWAEPEMPAGIQATTESNGRLVRARPT